MGERGHDLEHQRRLIDRQGLARCLRLSRDNQRTRKNLIERTSLERAGSRPTPVAGIAVSSRIRRVTLALALALKLE